MTSCPKDIFDLLIPNKPPRCRAGWIAVRTTALCLWFDSPTLGPVSLSPGLLHCYWVTSHWVASHHLGLHHSTSGCITAHHVASQRVGLHCVTSRRIGSRHIGSRRIRSGQLRYYRVGCTIIGSVALLSGQLRCYWACLVCFPSLLLSRSFAHSSPPLPAKV